MRNAETAVKLLAALLTLATTTSLFGGDGPVNRHYQALAERARRAATARTERLWDDAVIPYEIDVSVFGDDRAALFRAAMRHWENNTCVKFVEREPENDDHRNYIVFTERSCGCCSFVGKRGGGAQAISIGKHCDKFGIIVHELGHVVGFWHEHTRPDRDTHVKIIDTNIMQGQEYNFNKLGKDEVNSLGLAYDYNSILHYATNTFAKDTYLDTIVPLHASLNTEEVNYNQQSVNQSAQHLHPPQQLKPLGGNKQTVTSSPLPEPIEHPPAAAITARTTNSSSTGGAMINEATLAALQRDIESMVEFRDASGASSHNFNANQRPHRLLRRRPRLAALALGAAHDSFVLVDLHTKRRRRADKQKAAAFGGGGNNSKHRSKRRRPKRGSIDLEDAQNMLVMDDVMAKTRPEIGQRVRLSVGDIAQTNLLYKCPKCGRTIMRDSGAFHSPHYFDHQQQNHAASGDQANQDAPLQASDELASLKLETCEWRLSVAIGERIMLNVTDLDLALPLATASSVANPLRLGLPRSTTSATTSNNNYSHRKQLVSANCVTDYLEVRDGYTQRAPLLARLCGRQSNLGPIFSSSNRLLVTLQTSNSTLAQKARGFYAIHEAICGGLIQLGLRQVSSDVGGGPSRFSATGVSPIGSQQVAIVQTRTAAAHQTKTRLPLQADGDIVAQLSAAHKQPHLFDIETGGRLPAARESTATNTKQQDQPNTNVELDVWPTIFNTTQIQTANWPEQYRTNQKCTYFVKAPDNHVVSVRFDAFDIEPHESCAYDYVEVRDGLGGELLGRYCGNRIPEPIVSTSDALTVKFVSDSDVNRSGFVASLAAEADECKLGTHGCNYRCSNSVLPYKCECPRGFELSQIDQKSCVPMCGGFKNDSFGVITSPQFPDFYPASMRCLWHLQAPPQHRVMLNFTFFDLEGVKTQGCEYDFVEVRSGLDTVETSNNNSDKSDKFVINGVFCGQITTLFSVTSLGTSLILEFNSDNSIQKQGFSAQYLVDKDECATNNGNCQHICSNTIGSYQCSCNNGFYLADNKHNCLEGHCTYSITDNRGTFHSPNYPQAYSPNKECVYMFSTAGGHRIRLAFDQFDLESHQDCDYDYVAVFDGLSTDDPPLGRFCGSRKPLTIVSSFDKLYLLFKTDATNERHGFNATHSTVCGGRLQASPGHQDLIYSHSQFDGTATYGRNEDCEWLIEAGDNQRVKIEFTFFALEHEANCQYDVVEIYDGQDDSSSQLAKICGSGLPTDQNKLVSSAESMLIVFKTDDSINNRGFSLTYMAIDLNDEEQAAPALQTVQQVPVASLSKQI